MGSLILLMVATTIITMAIIKVEVAVAMVVIFIDHVDMEEAITEAITITNIINIIHMIDIFRHGYKNHATHYVL